MKVKVNNWIWIALAYCLCSACNQSYNSQLNEEAFKQWYTTSKTQITKQESVGDFQTMLKYIPPAVRYLKEKKNHADVQLKDYDEFTMFDLNMGNASGKQLYAFMRKNMDAQQYNYYYSYDFSKQIKAIQGEKVLDCNVFHYVKGIEQGKQLQFMIGFNELDRNAPFDVEINDDVFGNGKIRYHFEPSFFESIPSLKS